MTATTTDQGDWLVAMDGHEMWTDAFSARFGERVCVGIRGGFVVKDGEQFAPTRKEVRQMQKDYLIAEYGTSDWEVIARMEGLTQ